VAREAPVAPNLTPLGLAWANTLGSPRAVFEHVAAHVRSDAFQNVWAPAFGRSQSPLITAPDPQEFVVSPAFRRRFGAALLRGGLARSML
jgi:hypothetical protein